jgi:hypothetical protein
MMSWVRQQSKQQVRQQPLLCCIYVHAGTAALLRCFTFMVDSLLCQSLVSRCDDERAGSTLAKPTIAACSAELRAHRGR